MKKIVLLWWLSCGMVLFASGANIGIVYGLDPYGDGFLSLRAKPNSAEIGKLYNGDKVEIVRKKGKWYNVIDLKSGRRGWSFGKWIKIASYSSAQKKSSAKSSYAATQTKNTSVREPLEEKPTSNTFNLETISKLSRPKQPKGDQTDPALASDTPKNTFKMPQRSTSTTNNDSLKKAQTDTKEVIVSGYGINKDKALDNAFKNAVQQAVGVVVDADTLLKNNKLIKDDILTASNGYIQRYELISENQSDGLTEVSIKAVVKMQKVYAKVKSLNISTITLSDGKNIKARIKTKINSIKSSEVMLKKQWDDFFSASGLKEMFHIKIKNVTFDEKNVKDGKVPMKVDYALGINYDAYIQKVNKMEQLLSNIGIKSLKKADLPVIKEFYGNNRMLSLSITNVMGMRKLKDRLGLGFVKKYGEGYKLDMWLFPDGWKGTFLFPVNSHGRVIDISGYPMEDIFRLTLEAKSANGEVIIAKAVPSVAESPFLNKLNSSDYRYEGYNIPRIIVPLLHRYGFPIMQNWDYEVSYMVNIDDIDKIKKVTIEMEEI